MDKEVKDLEQEVEETNEVETTEEKEVKTDEVDAPDIDKMLQSASSKAKHEILKELGVKNVQEAKDLFGKYNEIKDLPTKYQELLTKHEELNETYTKEQDKKLLNDLGIDTENGDLFLNLIAEDDSDLSRLEKGQKVKEKLAKMLGAKGAKIGTSKTSGDNTLENKAQADLRKAMGL